MGVGRELWYSRKDDTAGTIVGKAMSTVGQLHFPNLAIGLAMELHKVRSGWACLHRFHQATDAHSYCMSGNKSGAYSMNHCDPHSLMNSGFAGLLSDIASSLLRSRISQGECAACSDAVGSARRTLDGVDSGTSLV